MKEKIIKAVEKEYGITLAEIQQKSRKRHLTDVRMVLSYLLRKHTVFSLERIGLITNRHYATVLHNVKMAENLYETNKDFKAELDRVEQMALLDETIIEADKAIRNLIKAFEVKQELEYEYSIWDNLTDTAFFGGDFSFNISDIYHDIKTEQPKGLIIQWFYDSIEHKQFINYRSYCMGLRSD